MHDVLFATEMFGAINAIDPKTGRNFEDIVPVFRSIEWLSDEDRYKITEGNARNVYSRYRLRCEKAGIRTPGRRLRRDGAPLTDI